MSRYQPKFFRWSEFDSRDLPGSGVKMQDSTVMMLDSARKFFGRAIVVRDGFRTRARQLALIQEYGLGHAAQTSAHEGGFAVDLLASGVENTKALIRALYSAGFRRFGIMQTSIHVDNDPARPTPAVWNYPTTSQERYNTMLALINKLMAAEARQKEQEKHIAAVANDDERTGMANSILKLAEMLAKMAKEHDYTLKIEMHDNRNQGS